MDRLRADSCVVTSLHAVTMISKCNTSLFYAPKPILLFQKHNMAINLKPKTLLVCVELKGHPYPPLAYSNTKPNKRSIQNVLLMEAKRDLESVKLE